MKEISTHKIKRMLYILLIPYKRDLPSKKIIKLANIIQYESPISATWNSQL